jgi:hypothetical protein
MKYTQNIVAAVVIAIIAVAAILLAAFYLQNRTNPASTPVVSVIVDGNFTINPESYVYYNFTVYSGPSNTIIGTTVQGTFSVSDGDENTIRVYIMDGANFDDWKNGLDSNKYYDSGQSNAGDVTVATLSSSGTYYLVYDNTYSAVSKSVTTQVSYAHW